MHNTADLNPMIERALLLGAETPKTKRPEAKALLEELEELVANLGIGVVGKEIAKARDPNPALLFGKGKVQEILDLAVKLKADSIIFDEPLSPAQQRNWDREAGGKLLIIDRQEIILDIFNSRAATKEASLQVELARLEYELPRMKRAWTHLDRQRGGGAVQRDAGETQLEMDQRMIRGRISKLKKELVEVVRHRDTQRKRRMKVPLPSAAIVGYTNAGKSSLLNLLSDADVMAEDKLFATLDPTTRRMDLPSGQTLLLTDTVGFIRRLPHRLVEAFKATLEEAIVSTFLIHLIDASSPDAEAHYATTMKVLTELNAEKKDILVVFNKIDMVSDPTRLAILKSEYPDCLFVSVKSGEGIEDLLTRCEKKLESFARPMVLLIPHERYDVINRLHEAGAISSKEITDEGVLIKGNIPNRLVEGVEEYHTKAIAYQ
ncbi:GTPase HflX [Rubellicoccus peritrichatus]|uniref:GTPase HflX n=1 Tax=Rubellicoccus peritrichatus TaxID=3080537 RepID=A0AAQ3QTP2_9BACT|nr:GTPase HflX [Puniceicoccus sp. CR14]WOO39603.1 GTPase HflX [Puniceicoccus sp. CR14]